MTSKTPLKPAVPQQPYVSADVAMLMHAPTPEKRAELERMYATSHMAIPVLPKK